MVKCLCGCGEITKGGRFRPGHDQKLRTKFEETIGGIENLLLLMEIIESVGQQQFFEMVNQKLGKTD